MDNLWLVEEVTSGTFVAPSGNAVSGLQSFSLLANDARIPRRESGRARAVVAHTQGTHMPSGSGTLAVEPDNFPLLLQALGMTSITTSTPLGATTARNHVFQFDDDGALLTLSAQAQQRRYGSTSAVNVRGLAVTSVTFDVTPDNYLTMSFDWLAHEATAAGTAFGNGDSSAAAITIAHGTLVRAFQFDQALITRGGTLSQDGTTKVISASGATTLSNVTAFSATVGMGMEQRTVLNSRYPAAIIAGNRETTLSLTLRNDDPSTTLWAAQLAGTQQAIIVKFTGLTDSIESGHAYELELTFPLVDYTGDDLFGELSADEGARDITLAGTALAHPTYNDFVLRAKNGTASY